MLAAGSISGYLLVRSGASVPVSVRSFWTLFAPFWVPLPRPVPAKMASYGADACSCQHLRPYDVIAGGTGRGGGTQEGATKLQDEQTDTGAEAPDLANELFGML